jgi:hypothetical protein
VNAESESLDFESKVTWENGVLWLLFSCYSPDVIACI